MASGIEFESLSNKKAKRREKQEARQNILDKAKKDYERDQWKKEQAKLRGEDTWILPALNDRLEREHKEHDKKTKKAKKEKKKKKKHKKEKKKKKSEDGSSSEDSDEEPVWIEKNDPKANANSNKPSDPIVVKGPQLQRDSWMENPLDLIPTITKKDILEQKRQEKEKEKKNDENILDMPGQHKRELNPYWKEGGTGLPEEKPKKSAVSVGVGDGGLSWMKTAYQRCVEQAKEEGRTLDAVATEKYGSLKKLEKMLSDAEKANRKAKAQEEKDAQGYKRSFQKPRDDSSDRHTSHRRSRSRSTERYKDYRRSYDRREENKSKNKEVRKSRSRSPYARHSKRHSRSRSKSPYIRKSTQRSRSRSPIRKSGHGSRSSNDSKSRRSRSPKYSRRRSRSSSPRSYKNIDKGSSSLSSRFKRPCDSDGEEEIKSDTKKTATKFVKPGNSDDEHEQSFKSYRKESSNKSNIPAWKKKEYVNSDRRKERSRSPNSSRKRSRSPKVKPKELSSSSSSSSESESSDSQDSVEDQKPQAPIVKILSEQEMNQLGAKIVRAELMGDNDLAAKLKNEMQNARELRERNKTVDDTENKKDPEEEDNVIVLTRTDRHGRSFPVPDMTTDDVQGGRRRKKKQKVDTHGNKGERKQYFDDDDKFDLKQLVEREKMGTAEDDSKMFSRLVARSLDKTSEEYQLDDALVDRAANKQSISISEMRERSQAIADHKKMAGAVEKCQFCFGNIPKHLIVAIGTKSYLCLPNHKSLTEGHCLIVPMHHSASSTAIDEDVWEEIQVFRKTLVKMFLEKDDEDIVFMETSMKLKYYPHMHIECVPLPKEIGDMAPIYFKKAIQESEHEWSDNKKLVDLKGRDVRKAIPKGFPYFSVDFGLDGGFAHVIEDERSFPAYFGREILGGMIDAEPQLWRKPSRENFDDQRRKVLQFAEKWKSYDWTQNLNKDADDSS